MAIFEDIYIDQGAQYTAEITLSLTATQTALLTAKRYVYDIEVESDSDSDEIYRVIQGTVHVSPNVTQ